MFCKGEESHRPALAGSRPALAGSRRQLGEERKLGWGGCFLMLSTCRRSFLPHLATAFAPEVGLWGQPTPLASQKNYRIHHGAQQTGPGDWEAGRKEGIGSKRTIWSSTRLHSICGPKKKGSHLAKRSTPPQPYCRQQSSGPARGPSEGSGV